MAQSIGMFLKLAWRNLWRNKRRTLITLASIFFAVVLSSLMMSIKEGTYKNMISSMIGSYVGYVQVQDSAYIADAKLDNALVYGEEIRKVLHEQSEIVAFAPRLESFALAAAEEITRGVIVVGADLEMEKNMHGLDQRVSEGEYLSENQHAAMVGAGLAAYLDIGVGDTLVLLGQGYHGVTAAGKYAIAAIIKYGSPELSKNLVILPLAVAQQLYGTEGKLTSIILDISKKDRAVAVAGSLNQQLPAQYEARPWEEITPELKNMIETDRVEGYVFMFILYMVIGFGILGTMIMIITERRREFGILVGIGMRKGRVALTFWLEILLLSIAGALAGILGAFPICAYFYWNPIRFGEDMAEMVEEYGMEAILQATIDPAIFIQQAIVVFIIASLVTLYPVLKLMKLNVMEYMRT